MPCFSALPGQQLRRSMLEDARQEPGAGYDGQPQLLQQLDLVELEPMLGHLPVSHAIELYRGKGDFPVRRRETLELTAVGAAECHPGRDRILTAPDLLDREAKVGKRPDKDVEDELNPGIGVQGAGRSGLALVDPRWSAQSLQPAGAG